MKIDLSESHRHEGFRSRLEASIAAELDRLEIHHGYEVPWTDPATGYQPHYLPDFTIEPCDRADDLSIPKWIEGKPQQMIYDLFEVMGLHRSIGTHFTEDVRVTGCDAQQIRDQYHDRELYKPKALAEMSGESVLVVGTVGAINRLSVEMLPTEIVFSRTHPFVNQVGIQRKAEREERQRQWAAEAERRRRQWEVEASRMAAQSPTDTPDLVRRIHTSATRSITPKFSSRCATCRMDGTDGIVYLCKTQGGGERWFRVCDACGAT